ncbi:MAG: Trk system potassium transporter TrkA [Oscillospiraceae bacterium]|nr:Trk system potassium transporter TrkA [Oscillospiraceae bacterium]
MSIFKKLKLAREKTLNIIIVGAGKVGSTLADKLTAEGNNVTVIDKSPERISRLATTYDIMGITGNGSSYGTLMDAGIENADLIIAVTDSDELNLLCCTLAKKVGNCSAIARVRTPDYAEELTYLRDKLGISMIINPELEAAREINRILHFPSAISVNAFAKGTVDMIKFKLPKNNMLCGMSLMEFRNSPALGNVLVCAVERGDDLVIPNGSFNLMAEDIVSFIATPHNAYKFFRHIGLGGRRVNSALIIGGGKTSFYLAKYLHQSGISVKIIESNFARCQELNELLPDNIVIVNGDGTDEQLLMQEDIASAGAVIPLTGVDEENVLLSLYAMRVAPDIKAVTKVNHINFSNVINELELGSVVYPRFMTAEIIRTYVRAKKNSIGSNIETLYRIFDERAEAIEFKIDGDSDFLNIPFKDLKLKDNLLIASILRNGKSFIPGGQDCFKSGDGVVIVTTHSGFTNIRDILG